MARQRLGDDVPMDQLELPAEVLLDPFDGQPLRNKGRGKERTVYSVGPNLKDDGGADLSGSPNGDIGVGPTPTAVSPPGGP